MSSRKRICVINRVYNHRLDTRDFSNKTYSPPYAEQIFIHVRRKLAMQRVKILIDKRICYVPSEEYWNYKNSFRKKIKNDPNKVTLIYVPTEDSSE